MKDSTIYEDIAKRTGGDIYIGVVGPVRTGKSTFIHRFMDTVVVPNIENEYDRQRAEDETPQSASGKTIMTTEPKFVPDEAVHIKVGDGTELRVKMIDCVGYLVDGALGAMEDGVGRMVVTPWSEEAIPFEEAAELGTSKVISEHSTIAMMVTTDGTITDIPRENYVEAEERVVRELRERGKPFAIILNSAEPESEGAHALAREIEEKYGAPVALVCCPELNADDIREILALVLGEFPVKEMSFDIPEWCEVLMEDHPLRSGLIEEIRNFAENVTRIGDIERTMANFNLERVKVDAGDGTAFFRIPVDRSEYYKYVEETCGCEVKGDKDILRIIADYADIKGKYDRVKAALSDVEEKGYGIVMPDCASMRLEEPRLEKSAGGYGVRISAGADSIHMIKAGIKAELCPVIGSEEQSAEVVKFLSSEYESNPSAVWEYNMFGKSLYDMVRDGMDAKLANMPDESREKLGETLGKIINEGSSGLICILL